MSAALQAIRRTVMVGWSGQQGHAAKALLLKTARDGHAEIMRRQGNPSFSAYANRPGNALLDSVVLPGPIVYTYSAIRQIVTFALTELRLASPRKSGVYADSHFLIVNGIPVDELPDDLKPSDEVMIANPTPYARKLEIGKTRSGRDFLISVPNRIYERVAAKVKQRYGNVAAVWFDYVMLPASAVYQKDNTKRSWLKNKNAWRHSVGSDRKKGMAIRSPCIVIKQRV